MKRTLRFLAAACLFPFLSCCTGTSDLPVTGYGDDGQAGLRQPGVFGGPAGWYQNGYVHGYQDRAAGAPGDYTRHKDKYDSYTRGQFMKGYSEGYYRSKKPE